MTIYNKQELTKKKAKAEEELQALKDKYEEPYTLLQAKELQRAEIKVKHLENQLGGNEKAEDIPEPVKEALAGMGDPQVPVTVNGDVEDKEDKEEVKKTESKTDTKTVETKPKEASVKPLEKDDKK